MKQDPVRIYGQDPVFEQILQQHLYHANSITFRKFSFLKRVLLGTALVCYGKYFNIYNIFA